MRVLSYLVLFGFLIGITVASILMWMRWAKASKEKRRARKVVAYVGFSLLIYGMDAFVIQMLGISGLFMSTPSHWNLPMGYAACIRDVNQQRFCVSTMGRVQKYAPTGQFVQGWFVDVWGGSARIRKTSDNTFQIITSRRSTVHTFDSDGALLSIVADPSRETYERTKEKSRYVPTFFAWMPLTHPLIALFTGLLGLAIVRLEDRDFWRSQSQQWRWRTE